MCALSPSKHDLLDTVDIDIYAGFTGVELTASSRTGACLSYTDNERLTTCPRSLHGEVVYGTRTAAASANGSINPTTPSSPLIREREHFNRGIMVSVGVSRMGKTSVVCVEPGAKVNSGYYCDHDHHVL